MEQTTESRLPFVWVRFADSQYDYCTSLSTTATKESAEKYFVGNLFDVGALPERVWKTCISIDFHPIDL